MKWEILVSEDQVCAMDLETGYYTPSPNDPKLKKCSGGVSEMARWEIEVVRRNGIEVEIIDLETMKTYSIDQVPEDVRKEAENKLVQYKKELEVLRRIINTLPDEPMKEITIEAKPVGGVAEPWTLSGDTDNAKEILESMGYKEIKLNPWNFDTVWRFGRLEEDDPLLPEKAEALKRIISRCFIKVNVMVRGRKVRELYVMRKGGRLK